MRDYDINCHSIEVLSYDILSFLMSTGEWISGAVCMYVASFLVENYEQNERVSLDPTAVAMYHCIQSVNVLTHSKQEISIVNWGYFVVKIFSVAIDI